MSRQLCTFRVGSYLYGIDVLEARRELGCRSEREDIGDDGGGSHQGEPTDRGRVAPVGGGTGLIGIARGGARTPAADRIEGLAHRTVTPHAGRDDLLGGALDPDLTGRQRRPRRRLERQIGIGIVESAGRAARGSATDLGQGADALERRRADAAHVVVEPCEPGASAEDEVRIPVSYTHLTLPTNREV